MTLVGRLLAVTGISLMLTGLLLALFQIDSPPSAVEILQSPSAGVSASSEVGASPGVRTISLR